MANLIKNVIITFDFDTETDTVKNVKCSVDKVEKKTRTSKKKEEVMALDPILTLESSKLIFNNKAVFDMKIEYEDRIIIEWIKEKNRLIPIIGKDIDFDKEGSGNKITKSNSIACRGKQNAVLADFGTQFTIKPYKDGLWELVSLANPDKEIIIEEKPSKPILPILEAEDGDNDIIIDDLTFKL